MKKIAQRRTGRQWRRINSRSVVGQPFISLDSITITTPNGFRRRPAFSGTPTRLALLRIIGRNAPVSTLGIQIMSLCGLRDPPEKRTPSSILTSLRTSPSMPRKRKYATRISVIGKKMDAQRSLKCPVS